MKDIMVNEADTNIVDGVKYDTDKARWDLLPLREMADVVKVYTAGAKKYGPNSWKNLPDGYNRYKAAMFRHLYEHELGVFRDPETDCIHMAQVVWNAIAMLYFAKKDFYAGKSDLAQISVKNMLNELQSTFGEPEQDNDKGGNKTSSDA